MITLITGAPGAGKTAFVVNELAALDGQRPLFVHAVPGLAYPHEPIYCRSTLCSHCAEAQKPDEALYVEDWDKWAPIGALIVIDEVQRIWRPRMSNAAVPESVAALETHRHRGVDFYLISQGPHLFDINVRRLVSRHIHLVGKWLSRFSYEWPQCRDETDRVHDAIKKPYKLPAKVFGQYKSAEVHTPQRHAKPLAFYALALLLPVLGFLGYRVYARLHEFQHPDEGKPAIAPAGPPPAATPVPVSLPSPTPAPKPVPDFQPREAGRPESAPAYDGLYRVNAAPIVMGCIGTPDACKCYTVKATVALVDEAWCRAYLRREVFYPYEPVPRVPHPVASHAPAALAAQR